MKRHTLLSTFIVALAIGLILTAVSFAGENCSKHGSAQSAQCLGKGTSATATNASATCTGAGTTSSQPSSANMRGNHSQMNAAACTQKCDMKDCKPGQMCNGKPCVPCKPGDMCNGKPCKPGDCMGTAGKCSPDKKGGI